MKIDRFYFGAGVYFFMLFLGFLTLIIITPNSDIGIVGAIFFTLSMVLSPLCLSLSIKKEESK